jgi:hypothetical protein
MIINKVTFTGADDKTDIKVLKELQREFSFVEWGILIASNPGRNRYPTDEWILNLKNKGLNLALHICSKWSRDIMSNGNPEIRFDFFDRYQINFNFFHTPHNLENYNKLITTFPNKKFILQSNLSNDKFIEQIIASYNSSNTNILYDSSGGRGTEIKTVKEPFKGLYTGYSGGLKPENVYEICDKIYSNKNTSKVWIDMETGVRDDNDNFDLDKCYRVLKIVDSFIHAGFKI